MFPDFHLLGETIFVYPLILGAIYACSFQLSKYLIQQSKMDLAYFNYYFIVTSLCMWAGAKALFLITLDHEISKKIISSSNFWLGGGLVFYGGAIGAVISTWIYTKVFKLKISKFAFLLPILALGHSAGRVACFMAGCCYGTACDLPWAIYLHGVSRHPVQLYESVCLLILGIILLRRYFRNKSVLAVYFIGYAFIRFILEFFRGDKIRGLYFDLLSTSQIISLIILACWGIYQLKCAMCSKSRH